MLTVAKTVTATATAGLAGFGCFGFWVQRGLAAHRALVPTVAMARARGEPGEQVDLPDGRKLGYLLPENFDPSGRVVVSIHGTPECRLGNWLAHKYVAEHKHPGWMPALDYTKKRDKELGLQNVTIDRWGVGLSSFKGDGTIADIGADIVALCNHLGVDKFMVHGASGGGPYAAACAAVIDPARLIGTCVVFPVGPKQLKKQGGNAAMRKMPDWQYTLAMLGMKRSFQGMTGEQFSAVLMKDPNMVESDKETAKERGDFMASNLRNSSYFQHGVANAVEENRLLSEENFGFDRRDMGRTQILAAKADYNTPVEHAEWYAEGGSEQVELRTYEGKGHFSLLEDLDVLEEANQFIDACFRDHEM